MLARDIPLLTSIKDVLDSTAFSEVWYSPLLINTPTFWSVIEERLMYQYIQQWRQLLNESTGKLRTYRQFKKVFELESYLQLPAHLRIPLQDFAQG